jgi:dTDP-4-dehydrorhamnose 3,5-epimerase
MNRIEITDLPLNGLKKVKRLAIGDSRGSLTRLFCEIELNGSGWTKPVRQINQTHTHQIGTIRGMHFQQPPHSEMKLVSCIRGEVWDVAIDLRKESPTFLQWHAELLSSENLVSMLIPCGFAHGFQTMSNGVDMVYCHSEIYSPAHEMVINPFDPSISIKWPLICSNISPRDKNAEMVNSKHYLTVN